MPKFFIEHPVFAWVVAILISLAGVISILNLGIESYPTIAPPQVTVTANFPGASADTAEKEVTQVIEQQLTGIDHLLYFNSSSAANGRVTITLTFETGTDADIAQVQVQNKVSLAAPRLPSEVTQQGVVVAKANAGFLMVAALRSDNPSINRDALNDIVGSRLLEQISRVPGVGSTNQFGAEYAMNIWLNPEKLQGYNLSATQVLTAVRNQNVQFAAGSVGADPTPEGISFTATVSAEGRFSSPEQFENIILRTDNNGATVRLKDVARVTVGPSSYGFDTQYNGKPTGAFGIQLLPGANALNVSDAVSAKLDELQPTFPQGVTWFAPYESTTFVRISIEEVIHTLVEAIVLVFLVMLLFLQNFRATVIPTLVIPVALLGTFFGMYVIGFTINQLTLFAMVLAIGIVVDDAIVVIENVERIMSEEHLEPKAATQKAMTQITGAVVAITVVLAAVFIPSSLQPGASGAIYKQFALTIAMSMGFSAFLALSFTPALCGAFLKSTHSTKKNWVYRTFDKYYDKLAHRYVGVVGHTLKRSPPWMIAFVALMVLCGFLFTRMPGSFLPDEDQGFAVAIVQLPPGATKIRTNEAFAQMRAVLEKQPAVEGLLQIAGFSFLGSGENVGMGFIRLKPWDERDVTAGQLIQQLNGAFHSIKGAQIFVVNLPTVQGLGQFGGFDMWLQDRSGAGQEALINARNIVLGKAAEKQDTLVGVRPNGLENAPQLQLHVDRVQAQSMGLNVSDIYSSIQLMLAPVYVNDYFAEGRIKRVNIRADDQFRAGPESLRNFFTPSTTATGTDGQPAMIPLSNVVKAEWNYASPALNRYNGYSAVNIVGNPAPGRSSGQAMSAMEEIVNNDLPPGFGFDWSGMSYQEIIAGNAATLLLALSVVVVFLCLAALYESWSIPVAVLMVVPIGVLGAITFSMLRGLPNDLYFKIGMITVIGLAAKNAILIVEFAVEQRAAGKSLREATLEAAHLRFRPILMTSFAFILGVLPLAISTGAGANARHSIGTGVIGGMVFATVLGLIFIPLFFVVVRRMLGEKLDEQSKDYLVAQNDGGTHHPDR
ncbi:multidrug efflux RND transporter permease subunit [Xanthomonas oryzae]|uniref:multidrug efflux RND transporter permease subunit n=1 Tax=Xanthomonas oryzae TaxID=347 RepID=UPI000949F220|nr:multidrug efflux RND transporter permease subunit [Xanthomonas oryzae]OLK24547.1 multidrug transporter [Xanthomonas oryzae pv. oryzae]OLK42472.1 multidrug transporter [Xanthomonas oryzae pv. oryzae]UXW32864.1 multidrug efflux RND transporter permease subunit [Xanthomonas oryzae pv. oryzae]UZF10638.1 multidrug efflux RND transporter permease subunit [Xanthomonas oryzae pv. oryzae]